MLESVIEFAKVFSENHPTVTSLFLFWGVAVICVMGLVTYDEWTAPHTQEEKVKRFLRWGNLALFSFIWFFSLDWVYSSTLAKEIQIVVMIALTLASIILCFRVREILCLHFPRSGKHFPWKEAVE